MIKEMIANFKKTTGRHLIPIGVGFALPLLYEKSGKLFLIIPLIEKLKTNPDGSVSLKKPVGELRFELSSQKMILFKIYFYDDPLQGYDWKTEFAKFPPGIAIRQTWSREKYNIERDTYYSLIDTVYENWKEKKYYSDKTAILKSKFNELTEDGMEKFYNSIVL
jgi:hypothetical protein